MVASTPVAIITRIINNAKIQLPGSIEPGIQYELYNVLDEFLRSAEVWTEDIPFEAQMGEVDYDVVPVNGRIVNFIQCWYADGSPEIGNVSASMPIPGWLQLMFPPTEPRNCLVKISLTVLDPVTRSGFPQCPTWVLERYHGTIVSGLVYKMASQPGKPYTSDAIAVLHGQKFRNEIGQAKVDYLHAHTRGAQRWRYPQAFMPMLRR